MHAELNKERGNGRDCYGLAVIGLDRVLDLMGKTPNLGSGTDLEAVLDNTARAKIAEIRRLDRGRLFPHAAIGGLLLVTSIFLEDRGGIFTVSDMGLFCTGPQDHTTCQAIKYELSTTIRMT